jgi:hypothetical protein
MTDPRPLTPVGEAQLLLTRHEPWSTETGAYLESDDVFILIEATEAAPPEVEPFRRAPIEGPDAVEAAGFAIASAAPAGPAPQALVDVLITLRSRERPAELRDLPIELVGPDGRTVTGRVGPRGQARFAGLPAGSWRTRLGAATRAVPQDTDTDASGGGGVVVPFRRISRVLADAAAKGTRHVREVLTSADDEVVTEVEETDEGRLVATVTTTRTGGLVRLRWGLVPAATSAPTAPSARTATTGAATWSSGRAEVRTLVTPLAERPEGGGVAKYDLGPVVEAVAVDLAPAEWAAGASLDAAGVRAAFDLVLYGSAVRAWEEFAASDACPGDLRPLIAEALAQQ